MDGGREVMLADGIELNLGSRGAWKRRRSGVIGKRVFISKLSDVIVYRNV